MVINMNDNNFFDLRLPAEMAKVAEQAGCYKATKKKSLSFFLAITAGVFIGLAFVFYITVITGSPANGLTKLAGGLCFAMGLILVVICGADLFTSTVLTVVARASGLITWRQLFANWIIVYIGNMAGALFLVALIWGAGQYMASGGQWGLSVLSTADHKLHHTFFEAVWLGTLCNLMVCLAVWMSYSGHSLTDKVVAMLFPVAMFVASGFEHSIANLFLIPMGIVIRYFAPDTFWHSIGMTADQFPALTVHDFIINNLIPVTIGNIIGGGVLVGITYWIIYLSPTNQKH